MAFGMGCSIVFFFFGRDKFRYDSILLFNVQIQPILNHCVEACIPPKNMPAPALDSQFVPAREPHQDHPMIHCVNILTKSDPKWLAIRHAASVSYPDFSAPLAVRLTSPAVLTQGRKRLQHLSYYHHFSKTFFWHTIRSQKLQFQTPSTTNLKPSTTCLSSKRSRLIRRR